MLVEQLTISTQRSVAQDGGKALRCRLEAVLQDDAERDAGSAAGRHQLFRARRRHVQGLLEKHVLAGAGECARDLQVGVGRGEDGRHADAAVRQDVAEVVRGGKGEAGRERRPARRRRAHGAGDLRPILQIEQALGVRRHGHAEADEGNAVSRHP